jgi:hypothetical protein
MAGPTLNDVISHWYHLFEGLQYSPQDFYAALKQAIEARQVSDVVLTKVEIKEGGILSAKRLYLRVSRKNHIFDICGAPFGRGFFVSWWLSELPSGCLMFFLSIPGISLLAWLLARPITYYKMDTALMFQQSIHSAVMEVLDQITSTNGVRALSETERKPIMREFFKR